MDYLPGPSLIRKTDDLPEAICDLRSPATVKFGFGAGTARLVLLTEQSTYRLPALIDTLSRDFEVLVAEDPENLKQLLELAQPDVIVLNTVAPVGSDWLRVYQQIRQISHCAHIPILILASSNRTGDRLRYLNRGAADYVVESASPEEVLVRAKFHSRSWLREKRLLAHNLALQAELKQQNSIQAALASRIRPGIIVTVKRDRWEIHFCSRQARETMRTYYAAYPKHLLPEPLSESIATSTVTQWQGRNSEGTLALSYNRIGKRAVLITLEEESKPAGISPNALCCLGLTPREAEVLYWIAEGKTSPEIAIIIGAAPTTIKKHVNHILDKLGVENRLSAALLANEILRRRSEFREPGASRPDYDTVMRSPLGNCG
jgi:DNA-binding NarL/FixJ family response regulator